MSVLKLPSRVHEQVQRTANRPVGWLAHALGSPPSLVRVCAGPVRTNRLFILLANGTRLLTGTSQAGKAIWTDHFRGSEQLPPLGHKRRCSLPLALLFSTACFRARRSRLLCNALMFWCSGVCMYTRTHIHTHMYGRRGARAMVYSVYGPPAACRSRHTEDAGWGRLHVTEPPRPQCMQDVPDATRVCACGDVCVGVCVRARARARVCGIHGGVVEL